MEYSAIASACGLLVMPVRGHHGAPDLDGVRWAIRRARTMFPAPGIVCLENTHNAAGGTVLTPGQIDAVAAAGHEAGFAVHLDGARVFNAAVALGVDVRDLTRSVDSVSVCLSKGLSAPVGSLVAGTRAFIDRANRVRRSLGGAMRQAGIIAAPGLVALRTMIPRLREDHEHARSLAERVAGVPGLGVDLSTVQSNIVNVDVRGLGIDASTFAAHLRERGVRGLPGMGTNVRFVTYRGITRADVEQAAAAVASLVAAHPWPDRVRRSPRSFSISTTRSSTIGRVRGQRWRTCASSSPRSAVCRLARSKPSIGACSKTCTCGCWRAA